MKQRGLFPTSEDLSAEDVRKLVKFLGAECHVEDAAWNKMSRLTQKRFVADLVSLSVPEQCAECNGTGGEWFSLCLSCDGTGEKVRG